MGSASRPANPTLRQTLLGKPQSLDFFQATRMLYALTPKLRQVGYTARPSQECVRFKTHQSIEFPASAIQGLETREDGPPFDVMVNFLGLTGPQGILPSHYTEFIIHRLLSGDRAAADFLDLFNHRFVSLFYRAWEKHHFWADWERQSLQAVESEQEVPTTGISQYFLDFIGLGTAGLKQRLAVPDQSLVFYGGLMTQKPHSAAGLASILADYFGVGAEILQFTGRWFALERDELTDLSGERMQDCLGEGAVIGDAVWIPQARFRCRLGPLSYSKFLALLPGGQNWAEANALVEFYAGNTMEFEMQLILKRAECPACILSDDDGWPRLGLTTWLWDEEPPWDLGDVVAAGGAAAMAGQQLELEAA